MNASGVPFLRRFLNKMTPAQFLVLAYGLIWAAGTAMLASDAAMVDGRLGLVDATFMAASALCVTGLSVVSIGLDFTVFGQITIALLIQIGALGVMTMSTLFAILLGRRIGLRNRMFLQEDLNQNYVSGVVRLVKYVLLLTLAVEGIGVLLLFVSFAPTMAPGQAAYNAVFHAISAFGNAGFDLFGSSVEGYVGQSLVLLVISSLFILGGLGFSVIIELLQWHRERHMSLHGRIVLWSTALLIASSWAAVLLLEFHNPATLGPLTVSEKLWASLFTAVTPRTAGFNVVPTHGLSMASLFLVMGLMFVGASPGSTGGGIKTTTFVALILGVWTTITGKKDVELGNRRISQDHMLKAWAITFIAAGWVILASMILLITENQEFVAVIFEVISAFGTVGLSLGITEELTDVGRVLLAVTMFMGRLGPMTLALALGQRRHQPAAIRMPEERIGLG